MNDAELRARTGAVLAIPLQVALHARPVDPDRPADGLEFPVTGLALNPGGTLHAGALGAIMELTGLLALLPALAANEHAVTHHIATQILSAGGKATSCASRPCWNAAPAAWASCRPRPWSVTGSWPARRSPNR